MFDFDVVTIPLGPTPFTVLAVDIDDDGKVDLVAPHRKELFASQHQLSIALARGDAYAPFHMPFEATTRLSSAPQHRAAAGIRGGAGALLVADKKNAVWWMSSFDSTTRSFASVVEVPVSKNALHVLRAVDANLDGESDVGAVEENGSNDLVRLFVGAATWGFAAGEDVSDADFWDIDGDGDVDAVVLLPESRRLMIRRQASAGTFEPPEYIQLYPDTLRSLARADLDGDGLDDVVVSSKESISLLYGTASGSLDYRSWRMLPAALGALSLGDINTDGIADLVTIDGDVLRVFDIRREDPSEVLSVTLPGDATSVQAADLNGDGTADVLAVTESPPVVTVLLNQTRPRLTRLSGLAIEAPLPSAAADHVWADVNGDTAPDLYMVGYEENQLYINNGDGTFTAKGGVQSTDKQFSRSVAAADLTGDGSPELIVANDETTWGDANRIYRNDGAGGFSVFPGGAFASDKGVNLAVCAADFTADGHADIALGRWSSANAIFINDGTGKTTRAAPVWMRQNFTVACLAQELNASGTAEAVFISKHQQPVAATWSGSRLEEWDLGAFSPFSAGGPSAILAIDQNGDSHADLTVVGSDASATFLNDGAGQLAALDTDNLLAPGGEQGCWADFDLDGDLDYFLARGKDKQDVLFVSSGGALVASAGLIEPEARSNSIGCSWVDVDMDGDQDLFVLRTNGLKNVLYQNNTVP